MPMVIPSVYNFSSSPAVLISEYIENVGVANSVTANVYFRIYNISALTFIVPNAIASWNAAMVYENKQEYYFDYPLA